MSSSSTARLAVGITIGLAVNGLGYAGLAAVWSGLLPAVVLANA